MWQRRFNYKENNKKENGLSLIFCRDSVVLDVKMWINFFPRVLATEVRKVKSWGLEVKNKRKHLIHMSQNVCMFICFRLTAFRHKDTQNLGTCCSDTT